MSPHRIVILTVTLALFSGLSCRGGKPVLVEQPTAPDQTAAVSARPAEACTASLNESPYAGQAFPEALVKDGVPCEGLRRVRELHCPGVYLAIADGGGYGGSVRYYDGERRLIGVRINSDTNLHCGGKSFNIVYGTLPTCPDAEIVTDLCRR